MSVPAALVVAYDFPPHAAIGTQRTLRVVRRLVECHWKVTVLTGDPVSFRVGTPSDPALLERVPSGVTVLRAPAWRPVTSLQKAVGRGSGPARTGAAGHAASAPRRVSAWRRLARTIDSVTGIPDAEIGWLIPAIAAGWRTGGAVPDVVYSSAPPWTGHLVAARLAAHFRRPLVLDFRDPWARAPWRSARSSRMANAAAARLERAVVHRASAVIFATHAAAREFAAWYGPEQARKFHVVSNGCDATLFDDLPAHMPSGPSILLHAGSLYGGRNPLPLLRAFGTLVSQQRIDRSTRVRFIGPVSLPGVDLGRECREAGVAGMVEFVERMSHRETLGQMRSASALLLLQPGTTMSVPAKAYEYLAAGRPVLALTEEGETADLIRGSGMGAAVPPADETAIASALLQVFELARGEMKPPARAIFDGTLRAAETEAILAAARMGCA